MSKLNHPSILKFIGFSRTNFTNELKPVIITEFMANDSLQEIIDLERKSTSSHFWNDTRKLINIYGIASAMSYLHAHNIIHRDLKPANILMDSFLCPKIADFGLSKSLNSPQSSMSLQSTVGFKGTPVYVAPEIWDHFEYTPAGDVYAFGFIVYEIVTTEEPFKGSSIMQIFKNIAVGKRPQFTGPVPSAYRSLIERCWDQDPAKRPTFDQIVIELRDNQDFITDLVDENDFLDYIDFIDQYKTTFDAEKRITSIDQFIKRKKSVFQRVKIVEKLEEEEGEKQKKKVRVLEFENSLENVNEDSLEKVNEDSLEKIEESEQVQTNIPQSTKQNIEQVKQDTYLSSPNNTQNIEQISSQNIQQNNAQDIKQSTSQQQNNAQNVQQSTSQQQNNNQNVQQSTSQQQNNNQNVQQSTSQQQNNAQNIQQSTSQQQNNNQNVQQSTSQSIQQNNTQNNQQSMKAAADKGDINAVVEYAKMLFSGDGIPSDKKESAKYYKIAADKGDLDSMFIYSQMLLKGDGVPLDKKEAAKYCRTAAQKGHLKAMVNFSLMLSKGIGVPVQKKEAVRYCKLAADKGDLEGMAMYAQMLSLGNGVVANKKEAAKYYKLAADHGDYSSTYIYAMMMYNGDGVAADKTEAAPYLRKLAEKGDISSILLYAQMLSKGEGVPVDKKEAAKLYKIASDKGMNDSTYEYSKIMYEEGNKEEAAKYFKIAADQGNNLASFKYGMMLYNGEGIEVDKQKSLEYIKTAAQNGVKEAADHYINVLENGDGVSQNKEEASLYIRKKALDGDVECMYRYGLMRLKGDEIKADKKEAATFIQMAAAKNNVHAMYTYGLMLLNGDGVRQSKKESQNYFKMASELCPPFENKLGVKIEPFCSFAVCGDQYITQKSYCCKTCNLEKNLGVCEVCANKCHKDHDMYFKKTIFSSYCDCPSHSNCQCMPKDTNNLVCTYETTFGIPTEQPMYQCLQCRFDRDRLICQNCALTCHKGHDLIFMGIKKNQVCKCFEHTLSLCSISKRPRICTRAFFGKEDIDQLLFNCDTCGLNFGECICSACAMYCHGNHEIRGPSYSTGYCDCTDRCNCQCLKYPNTSYLNRCSSIENSQLKKQRMYHCLTCSIVGPSGICEACAISCHYNHVVEFVGESEFFNCRNAGKCHMRLIPPIHNNRNVCDRKVVDKDDISACYVCYTCDNSGNKKFCETCALKNHRQHDIHLVGYMKFECSEINPIYSNQNDNPYYSNQDNNPIYSNQDNNQTYNNQDNNQTYNNQNNNQTYNNQNNNQAYNNQESNQTQRSQDNNEDDDCLIS